MTKKFSEAETFDEAQSIHFMEDYPELQQRYDDLRFNYHKLRAESHYNARLLNEYINIVRDYKETNKRLLKVIKELNEGK